MSRERLKCAQHSKEKRYADQEKITGKITLRFTHTLDQIEATREVQIDGNG
jgi:hypothetical protein